jgi:hypothetical protein
MNNTPARFLRFQQNLRQKISDCSIETKDYQDDFFWLVRKERCNRSPEAPKLQVNQGM